MSIGNRKPDPAAPSVLEGIHFALVFIRFLAVPNELVFRAFASGGHRYMNWAFPGVFVPLLFGAVHGKPDPLGRPQTDPLAAMAFLAFLALWVIHHLSYQANRGKLHSKQLSRTWFCRDARPGVELLLGTGLAWLLSGVSAALGTMFLFSSIAGLIYVHQITLRNRLEVDAAMDSMIDGEAFGQRLGRHRRR